MTYRRLRWTTLALVLLTCPPRRRQRRDLLVVVRAGRSAAHVDRHRRARRRRHRPAAAGIPGNVTDTVVADRRPAARTRRRRGQGEPRRRLARQQVARLRADRLGGARARRSRSRWCATRSPRPTTRAERDPRDWTLQGSDDGQTLDDARHPHRPELRRALPDARSTTSPTPPPTSTTGSTSPATAARASSSSPSCSSPTASRTRRPRPSCARAWQRPPRRLQRQARRRLHRAAARSATAAGTPRRAARTPTTRSSTSTCRSPRDAALVRDLPRLRARRPRLPEHLRGRRPALHRRHVPERPGRGRPARRDAQPARPGRLQDAVHEPVERQALAHRRASRPASGSTASSSPTTTRGGTARLRRLDRRLRIGPARRAPHARPSDWVITTRGTNSSGSFSRGNNIPATAVPHGFNFWTPVTNAGTLSWLYDYQRDNNADNLPTLEAFSASHEPSPWMGDRQTFQVMPSAREHARREPARPARSPFRHANEAASPHYYGVTFENGLKTEIAPTDHAALFRFTFPGRVVEPDLRQRRRRRRADHRRELDHRLLRRRAAGSPTAPRGCTSTRRSTSRSRAAAMLTDGNRPSTGYARFDARTVNMRIATSLISIEQAKHNLALELAGKDTVESVKRARAAGVGRQARRASRSQGATEDQLTTLYSNLYRLFLYPNSAAENTGTNARRAVKHAVQSSTETVASSPTQTGAPVVDGKVYVNNGFWDTYRTTWSAYSLFTPQMAGELVDGFVQQYRDGGWIARWSSPGYANLMTGTSSDVAFADAYVKGVKGFDARRRLRRGAQERHGGAARRPVRLQRRPQGPVPVAVPRLHAHRACPRACRGRWRATSTTTASPTWPRSARPIARRTEYFLSRAHGLREHVRPARSASSRAATRRGAGSPPPDELRPARVGPRARLHRDGRLGLRLPRAAGRAGAGEPLRRPGRAGEEARRVLLHARDGDARRLLRRRDPRDASRRATCGWASGASPTRSRTTSRTCTTTRGSRTRRPAKVREALRRLYVGLGDRPGLRRRRGQRRDVRLVPVQRARPLPAAGRQRELRGRLAAVPRGDGAPRERPRRWSSAPAATARATSTCRGCAQRAAIDRAYLPHSELARGGQARVPHGPAARRGWATGRHAAPPSITKGAQVAAPAARPDRRGRGHGERGRGGAVRRRLEHHGGAGRVGRRTPSRRAAARVASTRSPRAPRRAATRAAGCVEGSQRRHVAGRCSTERARRGVPLALADPALQADPPRRPTRTTGSRFTGAAPTLGEVELLDAPGAGHVAAARGGGAGGGRAGRDRDGRREAHQPRRVAASGTLTATGAVGLDGHPGERAVRPARAGRVDDAGAAGGGAGRRGARDATPSGSRSSSNLGRRSATAPRWR